jgi:hypothetical protein
MTVSVPGQLTYSTDGDGVTTSFSYPVRFLAKAEIKVYLRENGVNTLQVLNTHYTIAGSSWPSGGNIVFLTPPTALQKVVLYRDTAATQTVDLANTQRNDAPAAEVQFDRHAMVEQDIKEQVGRSWKADFGSVAGSIVPGGDDTVGVWSGGNLLGDGPTVGEIANAAENADAAEAAAALAESALAATLSLVPAQYPATIAALEAINTAIFTSAFLKENTRQGQYTWTLGDFAARVAADTAGAYYVKANAVSASVGAWVYAHSGTVRAPRFGSSGIVAAGLLAALLGLPLYLGDRADVYTITSTWTVPDNLFVYSRLFGGYGAKIDASSSAFWAVQLGDNSSLVGIELVGNGNAAVNSNSVGVYQSGTATGSAPPTYINAGVIEGCYIHGFGMYGIYSQYTRGGKVSRTRIENIGYTGYMGLSVLDTALYKVDVKDCSPGSSNNAYGITFSKVNGLVTYYPKSERCTVDWCTVSDVPLWHGFDTHGGDYIKFTNCIAYNCGRAFVITFASNVEGAYASTGTGFDGCMALQPYASKTLRGEAFWIVGASDNGGTITEYAQNCYVRNCVFDGYGFERIGTAQPLFPGSSATINTFAGQVGWLKMSRNSLVTGNIFRNCVGSLRIDQLNLDFLVSGNNAYDFTSEIGSIAGIAVTGITNTGRITNNTLRRYNGALATYTANVGLSFAASLTGLAISFDEGNSFNCPTPISIGASTLVPAYDSPLLTGSAVYDPASLIDGAGVSTTIACVGAALGDFARATFSLNLQGILMTAWVSAADVVSVRFQNETGVTIDLLSGTIQVRVEK